jgi:hypothetical protein
MSFNKLLVSIEALSTDTVRFTLTEPQAPFLADIAMDFATIRVALSARDGAMCARASDRAAVRRQPGRLPSRRGHRLNRLARRPGDASLPHARHEAWTVYQRHAMTMRGASFSLLPSGVRRLVRRVIGSSGHDPTEEPLAPRQGSKLSQPQITQIFRLPRRRLVPFAGFG